MDEREKLDATEQDSGHPNWDRRSFATLGMEYVDPKYVVAWHRETGEPLLAINPDEGKVSVDPRYVDSDEFFKEMYAFFDEPDANASFNKGFGQYMK